MAVYTSYRSAYRMDTPGTDWTYQEHGANWRGGLEVYTNLTDAASRGQFYFDLPFPDETVISGIGVRIKVRAGAASQRSMQYVEINQSGKATVQCGDSGYLPTTAYDYQKGGPTELWGRTWTAADLRDPTLHVAVQLWGSTGYYVYIDVVEFVVYADHGLSVTRAPTHSSQGTGQAWGNLVYLDNGEENNGAYTQPSTSVPTSTYVGGDFHHAIPATAEVVGIRLRAKGNQASAGAVGKLRGEMGVGGATRDGANLPVGSTFTWYTMPQTDLKDLWGASDPIWATGWVNTVGWGPGFRGVWVSGGTPTIGVDVMETTVVYKEAAKKIDFEHNMAAIPNIAEDPGFETGVAHWLAFGTPATTLTQTTAEKHSGAASMQMVRAAGAGFAGAYDTYPGGSVSLTVKDGQVWRMSAWCKAPAGVPFKIYLAGLDASLAAVGSTVNAAGTGNGAWQFIQTPWLTVGRTSTPGATAYLRVHVYDDSAAASTLYWDDVVLESALLDSKVLPSPGYYQNDFSTATTGGDGIYLFSAGGAPVPSISGGKLAVAIPQSATAAGVYAGGNYGGPGGRFELSHFGYATTKVELDPGVNGIQAIFRLGIQVWGHDPDEGPERRASVYFTRKTDGTRVLTADYDVEGVVTPVGTEIPIGQDSLSLAFNYDTDFHGWTRLLYDLEGGAGWQEIGRIGPMWPFSKVKKGGFVQLFAVPAADGYPLGGGAARFDDFTWTGTGELLWPVYNGVTSGGLAARLLQTIAPTSIAPPAPVLLTDDFEDGTIDTAKWSLGGLGAGSAVETGGQLRITTGPSDPGVTAYSQVYSQLSYPMAPMTVTTQFATTPTDPFISSGYQSLMWYEGSSPTTWGLELYRRLDGVVGVSLYEGSPPVTKYSGAPAADLRWVRFVLGRDDLHVQLSRDGFSWQTLWTGPTPAGFLTKTAARMRHAVAAYLGANNSVTNPGFETNLTGWVAYAPGVNATITRDTTEKYAGVASCKVDVLTTAAYAGLYLSPTYTATVRPGQRWRVSARIKAPVGYSPTLGLWALNAAGTWVGGASFLLTGDGTWKEAVATLASVPADTTQLQVLVTSGGTGAIGTFYVDEVVLARANAPLTGGFDNSSVENDPIGDHRVVAGIHLEPEGIAPTAVVSTENVVKLAGVLRPFGIDNVEALGSPRVPHYTRQTSIVDPDAVGQPTLIREAAILPPQPRVEIAWRILLCDRNGTPIEDISGFALDRQISYRLNRPEVMTFRVPSDHRLVNEVAPDGRPNLTILRRVIKAYRAERQADGSTSYVLRFVGHVWQLQDEGDADNAWTTVTAFGMLQRLQRRISTDSAGNSAAAVWTNVDGGLIIHSMLSQMNAGETWRHTGVQPGIREVTSARTVDLTNMSLAAAIVQLTNAFNGFDIRMLPLDRRDGVLAQLDVLARRGAHRAHAILGWGLPPHNVISASRLYDAETYANVVTLQGATPEVDGARPIQAAAESLDEEQAVGIYRSVESYPDVSNQSYLQALATEELGFRVRAREIVSLQLQPGRAPEPFSEFDVGDTLPLFVGSRLRSGFQGRVRVYGFDLEINNEGQEIVSSLVLSPEGG